MRLVFLALGAGLGLGLAACEQVLDEAGLADEAASGGGAAAASGGSVSSGGAAAGGQHPGLAGAATSTGGSSPEPADPPDPPVLEPLTVFLAGDSTVSSYVDTASPGDQAGWGQMLHESLDALVTIENRAVGGRSSRRFIEEGNLQAIWDDIAPGDYLLVQFGTNDSNKLATYVWNDTTIPYYLAPGTDFKSYLSQYIDGAKSRGAVPVLVTPPPRNSAYCTGGNGTGAYAQAMRELGAALTVEVLDLNARSLAHLKAICPAPTPENFFLLRADGSVDGTHFQEGGARKLAGFVALELAETELSLAAYLD